MEDFNRYQKAIETLVNNGNVIVQIINPDNSAFYFSVYKFEESYTCGTGGVEFNLLEGINITDFMRVNASQVNQTNLLAKFDEVLRNSPVIRCEFSKHIRWYKWGIAGK